MIPDPDLAGIMSIFADLNFICTLMRDCPIDHGNGDKVLLRLLPLLNSLRYFCRFVCSKANPPFAITDNNRRTKSKSSTSFDNAGDTINLEKFFLKFFTSLSPPSRRPLFFLDLQNDLLDLSFPSASSFTSWSDSSVSPPFSSIEVAVIFASSVIIVLRRKKKIKTEDQLRWLLATAFTFHDIYIRFGRKEWILLSFLVHVLPALHLFFAASTVEPIFL